MNPAVSVIIPTYNSVALLEEALQSVWSQTLKQDEIELIIVDDGSTDETWEFLLEVARSHENVYPLHQSNAGRPSVGRNRGMETARGEFIFFLDSDDWLGPEALERLVQTARETGSDVVLGRQRGENRTVSTAAFNESILDADLLEDGMWEVLSPCRLFRRSLIELSEARFPEDMVQGEDQVFVATCCFAAEKISVLADYDYYFVRGRADGENLSRRVQSFQNKYLTTTRMAELIMNNTEPGRVRERYFHRVIYRTLAPGLGKPFMAASRDEQDCYLPEIQRTVLANMVDQDLKARPDIPRLRLSTAQLGDTRDLISLNEMIAAGVVSRWDGGQLILDLGPNLNQLLGRNIRVRRNELRSQPKAADFELDDSRLTIRVSHASKFLDGTPHPPELVMKVRNSDQQRTYTATSWNKKTESIFIIEFAEFLATDASETAILDPRLALRGRDQFLDMGRIGLAANIGRENLAHNSVPKQFSLYRSQNGNLSIRLPRRSGAQSQRVDQKKATPNATATLTAPTNATARFKKRAVAILNRMRG